MIGVSLYIDSAKETKLSFEFLYERGFVPVCVAGPGNTVYEKWGFRLDIHMNFICCVAEVGSERKYIQFESELIELEKQLNIDQTPNIMKMDLVELRSLIPKGYEYKIDNRRKKIKPTSQVSYINKKGRYKIVKDGEVISEAYADEEEEYFLCHALLYILKKENMLFKNPVTKPA